MLVVTVGMPKVIITMNMMYMCDDIIKRGIHVYGHPDTPFDHITFRYYRVSVARLVPQKRRSHALVLVC